MTEPSVHTDWQVRQARRMTYIYSASLAVMSLLFLLMYFLPPTLPKELSLRSFSGHVVSVVPHLNWMGSVDQLYVALAERDAGFCYERENGDIAGVESALHPDAAVSLQYEDHSTHGGCDGIYALSIDGNMFRTYGTIKAAHAHGGPDGNWLLIVIGLLGGGAVWMFGFARAPTPPAFLIPKETAPPQPERVPLLRTSGVIAGAISIGISLIALLHLPAETVAEKDLDVASGKVDGIPALERCGKDCRYVEFELDGAAFCERQGDAYVIWDAIHPAAEVAVKFVRRADCNQVYELSVDGQMLQPYAKAVMGDRHNAIWTWALVAVIGGGLLFVCRSKRKRD